ncbi:hypothetical protein [Stenotrophomonas sp. JAI102]|uniref:hypothetical protein n=1 Tax=Stenotrophomonas sp. JAI102 TaxID=2723077 RepID=UPI0015C86C38|nr:hypothetical protein [Stenotrophomonas sp. JAI102]NYF36631.1 hypothetical protein [Stenotrophomonas sp. JAI102]
MKIIASASERRVIALLLIAAFCWMERVHIADFIDGVLVGFHGEDTPYTGP